jgi:hypothetical protein
VKPSVYVVRRSAITWVASSIKVEAKSRCNAGQSVLAGSVPVRFNGKEGSLVEPGG